MRSATHRPAGDLETEERLSDALEFFGVPCWPCLELDGRNQLRAARLLGLNRNPSEALPGAPSDVAESIGADVGRRTATAIT